MNIQRRECATALVRLESGEMTEDQIRAAVARSIAAIKTERPQLDLAHVSERCTAHRLAVHLDQNFPGWNVDCEYNRDEQQRKLLETIHECRGTTDDSIFPDIIVHHRQQPGREHNLLVVELKRYSREDACDRRKLELLTDPDGHYAYQFGLYINIKGGAFDCTWYKDGTCEPT